MSNDRAGKAYANERKYPFIVEVPVAANGLDVELSRHIVDFTSRAAPHPDFDAQYFARDKVTTVGAFPI
jgi:hypothetical protein